MTRIADRAEVGGLTDPKAECPDCEPFRMVSRTEGRKIRIISEIQGDFATIGNFSRAQHALRRAAVPCNCREL
jgi:hypothetical protein